MRAGKAISSWWSKLERPQKVVLTTLLMLFVGVAGFLSLNDATASKTVDVMPDLRGQPTLGNSGPLLILVEDFHCEHCKHFTETVFPELEARAQRGVLRVVYINPARSGARQRTAAAAECIYRITPANFWHYKKSLYRFQTAGGLKSPPLFELAGLSKDTLMGCIDAYGRDQATRDYQTAKAAGVQATPSVIIGKNILANPSLEQIIKTLKQPTETASAAGCEDGNGVNVEVSELSGLPLSFPERCE